MSDILGAHGLVGGGGNGSGPAATTKAIIELSAQQDQSIFTGLNYPTDKVQVFYMGVLLPSTDYTANGTSLVLNFSCDLGDNVTLIGFGAFVLTEGGDTGTGFPEKTLEASEAITAGSLVNLWNNTGTLQARLAKSTDVGYKATAFAFTAGAITETITVRFGGEITGLTGLTPGVSYYLSTTAGQLTSTAPLDAPSKLVQFVGIAISETSLLFTPNYEPIKVNVTYGE